MREQPKPQRKSGRLAEQRVVEQIRIKEILGDILDLVANSKSITELRKTLNSASWQIKKAILMEALELGHIERASRMATEILNLTEVKEKKISGNFGIDVNQNIKVLMAEITDIPYEVLEERAEKIKKEIGTQTGAIEQTKRIGAGPN